MRLPVALLALCWSLPALAGVTLVPAPPLVGDGETQGTVRLYVDSGAKVRVKAETGKVEAVAPGADGVVTVLYTPPLVTAARTVAIEVKGGGEDTKIEVPVVPPFKGELGITFDPEVLGAAGTATVRIKPSHASPVANEQRRFLITASAGMVDTVVPAGDGTWVARYTPPKGLTTPLPVAIVAVDAAAPDRVYGHAILPVTVKRSFTVDVKPGSSNILEVGNRRYGPVVAAPSGKAAFEIELDPREDEGDLQSINPDTSKDERKVPLPKAVTQLVFFPLPAAAPADGATKIAVRVAAIAADGDPISAKAPEITASKGTVSPPEWDAGVWVATLTPPSTPGEVVLTVKAEGATAEKRVKLTGSVPSIALSPEPAEVPKGASTFKVVARVKDANGTAMPGRAPTFGAVGAAISGAPKDNRDGSYTTTWRLSAPSARVWATPAVDPSGLPPARLVAWTSSATVPANGTDTVQLVVVAVDALGLPVPNVDLRLGVPRSDGTLPPTAKTDAKGVARVAFKAGKAAGIGAVRVEGGGLVTEVPVFQTLDGVGVELPAGGDAATEALRARWQAAAPETRVSKEGTVPPSGPPARMAVSSVPPYTTPGAAILVTVRVVDSAGKGVAGQKLAITAAPGTVGTVTDNKDGTYAFPVQLAAGQDGPVSLTVAANGVNGTLALPTLSSLGNAPPPVAVSGGTVAPQGAAAPGSTVRVNKPAKPAGDHATFRLGAVLSDAHGAYVMNGDAGAQLVGAAKFSTPGAGFWGVGVQATWLPMDADWGMLGMDARVRGQLELFEIADESFVNLQRDVNVGVAYRRMLAGPVGVQGTLGGHYTTGVLFRYVDAALADTELLNFPLVGARLGAAGVLETGRVFATLEVAETFVPFPVDTHVEGNVDIAVGSGNLTVRVGGFYDLRSMSFEASEGGGGEARVQQGQFGGQAGVGMAIF